ncbi:DMT family transporter [Aquipuribacter sp. SD81]|uniref:DMT family transporter n=1 Tax=Aquipuribacter sp. SD81 TaxID=3127703 RepID=UPI0030187989
MTEPGVQAPVRPEAPGAHLGRGWTLVLLGIALFVVNAGVSRLALTNGVDPVPLAAVRIAGTALVLLLVLLATGRASRLRLRAREVPLLLAYGLGGVGLVQVSYFVAIQRLPIGLALLLEYLAPLLVALVARFVLRERVSALLWPALALSLGGLALALGLGGDVELDTVGVVAGLVAAGSFATYFLLGERIVRTRDALSTTFWGFAVPGLLSLAFVPWRSLGGWTGQPVALPDALGAGEVALVLVVAWVVVLGTLSPFAAETAALRWIPATLVTVVATLEPVGAAVLAWWWFGEALTALQVVGFCLVLGGVVLALVARSSAGTGDRPDAVRGGGEGTPFGRGAPRLRSARRWGTCVVSWCARSSLRCCCRLPSRWAWSAWWDRRRPTSAPRSPPTATASSRAPASRTCSGGGSATAGRRPRRWSHPPHARSPWSPTARSSCRSSRPASCARWTRAQGPSTSATARPGPTWRRRAPRGTCRYPPRGTPGTWDCRLPRS